MIETENCNRKFPFISKISDIVDPIMLEVILKGFNDVIKQGIVFISDIDKYDQINLKNSRQIPNNNYMLSFACNECVESMNKNKCQEIRTDELNKFKEKPTYAKLSFYLCESNNKLGLHMHYPIFTDDKFIGLLISGTGRFSVSIEKEKANQFIDDLNNNEKDSIASFLNEYEVTWFDKETLSDKDRNPEGSIRLNYNNFVLKSKHFEDTAIKLIKLLDSLYTGNIRKKNRDFISDILEHIFPVFGDKTVYGKEGYINNFDNVFKFIKENIFNIGNILLFDDFTHRNIANTLGQTLPVLDKYSKKPIALNFTAESIDLLFNKLDSIDNSKVNFFWKPKDEFIYLEFPENIKEKRKIILNSITNYFDESFDKKNFLLLMPFNIYGKSKALIIFYDDKNIIPYGSKNLMFFFKRVYDIFKFSLHIYYNQIVKSNSIKMLIHDYRSRGGDIYAKTNYLLNNIYKEKFTKLYIKRELITIKNSSDSYINGFDMLNKIGSSDYEVIGSYVEEEIDLARDILYPIYDTLKSDLFEKSMYMIIKDIENIKIFANRRNLYLVFQNLITNAVKYSFKNTKIYFSFNFEMVSNMISISIYNLTLRLSDIEFDKIMKEQFRSENAVDYFGKLNDNLNLHPGEGIGLMSIKNIDDLYEWECIIEQLSSSEYKYDVPLDVLYTEECSVFRATIKNISTKKKGDL
jgi:hypothetical protein